MIPNKKEIDQELARRYLLDFTLYTKPDYEVNWHHELLCNKLDQFASGKCPRLMIFMPPRHGKSELGSRRLPAYILGKDPDAQVIACSYSADLASRMNRDVQRIVDTKEYREIFPGSTINSRNVKNDARGNYVRNSEMFEIVGHKGSYRASGVGGGITGMGANYAIIDDPIKNMEDANSQRIRENIWDWYVSTLYTRLEGVGNVLVILTRWHEDDLAGRLLERAKNDPGADQWEVFELPAVKEDDSNSYDVRSIGESLWPTKYDENQMAKIKASVGSKVWASLYQQQPTPGDGSIIQRPWLKTYYSLPTVHWDQLCISADLSFKDTKTADFVVLSVYAKKGANIYLVDQVRDRMDFVKTVQQFERLCLKHPNATVKYVEEKANGAALISVLKEKIPGIVPVNPKESKSARAHAVAPYYEAGNIHYPDKSIAPWIEDHIQEIISFPFVKNDDRVDAETQAISKMLTGAAGEWTEDMVGDYNGISDSIISDLNW